MFVCVACGSPAALNGNQSVELPKPQQVVPQAAKPTTAVQDHSAARAPDGTVVPARPGEIEGAHSYEGDSANSVTIKAGDIFTCTNPDFSQPYTFKVESINPGHIRLAADDPSIIIQDNGGEMPYMLHATEGHMGKDRDGKEIIVPICWARFTPRDGTPVAQMYGMHPGGTITLGQDDN